MLICLLICNELTGAFVFEGLGRCLLARALVVELCFTVEEVGVVGNELSRGHLAAAVDVGQSWKKR